jgi:deazaflavin-dependent oxidoreductase (nitroreductase family)
MKGVNAMRAVQATDRRMVQATANEPRFGGVLWRLARATSGLMRPLAGKRWNPVFAVVLHRGRRTGRSYAAPIAARRVDDGFVVSLAFGAQVDWHRNLLAAGGGTIRWRGQDYPVTAPERMNASEAFAAFHPIQRALMRFARVDGFIRVRDRLVAQ